MYEGPTDAEVWKRKCDAAEAKLAHANANALRRISDLVSAIRVRARKHCGAAITGEPTCDACCRHVTNAEASERAFRKETHA